MLCLLIFLRSIPTSAKISSPFLLAKMFDAESEASKIVSSFFSSYFHHPAGIPWTRAANCRAYVARVHQRGITVAYHATILADIGTAGAPTTTPFSRRSKALKVTFIHCVAAIS